MNRRVCDRKFQASHTKAPRGWGRWGFIFNTASGEVVWFCPIWSKFTDARRAAIRQASMMGGVFSVEVAP